MYFIGTSLCHSVHGGFSPNEPRTRALRSGAEDFTNSDFPIYCTYFLINSHQYSKLVGIGWSLLSSPSYTYAHYFSLIGAKI